MRGLSNAARGNASYVLSKLHAAQLTEQCRNSQRIICTLQAACATVDRDEKIGVTMQS